MPYWKSLPGSLSHPPCEEPRDGRADGGERLHGGPDGRRDPRYRRVGATVLGDDVAVEVLHGVDSTQYKSYFGSSFVLGETERYVGDIKPKIRHFNRLPGR